MHGASTIEDTSSPAGRRLRVRDLPPAERPRERLAALGASALSDRELLAVLLGSGSARTSSLEAAERLVRDGVRRLGSRTLDELAREDGVGPAGGARILAALELGARLSSGRADAAPVLRSPAECARYLLPRYATRAVETFGILALDVRHRLRREAVISVGCLTSSLVHPREVFREAIDARAAAMVAFHNHPSGDPEPSAEDVALTRRLASGGRLIGIEVLDHLVLGDGRFVSLKDRGVL